MRRAAILAAVLVMALGGVAQAKASVQKVTGTFSYYTIPDNPASFRALSLSAQATDPVKGTWTWTRPNGTFSGPVTCLQVDGDDAWLAGFTAPANPLLGAVFFWVRDGGTPSTGDDMVFGWAADEGFGLESMEAACEGMWDGVPWPGGLYPISAVPVASGNIAIHPAK